MDFWTRRSLPQAVHDRGGHLVSHRLHSRPLGVPGSGQGYCVPRIGHVPRIGEQHVRDFQARHGLSHSGDIVLLSNETAWTCRALLNNVPNCDGNERPVSSCLSL